MKDICISGYGVQKQTFQYGFHITSVELAQHVGLSVKAIEAMTEDDLKVLMLKHKRILTQSLRDGEAELDWPYNPAMALYDDFEVEIDEEESA